VDIEGESIWAIYDLGKQGVHGVSDSDDILSARSVIDFQD
jgi:hypothetical protein